MNALTPEAMEKFSAEVRQAFNGVAEVIERAASEMAKLRYTADQIEAALRTVFLQSNLIVTSDQDDFIGAVGAELSCKRSGERT